MSVSSPSPARTERNMALDVTRAVGCFLIVLVHACMNGWYAMDPSSVLWKFNLVGIALSYPAVPLFFMISGALFLDPKRSVTVRRIWTHTLPHLAIIYFAWSFWFSFTSSGIRNGITTATLTAFLKNALYGASHQWFLWPLAGFYIATPILRRVVEDKRLLEYFLAVAFFLSILPVSSHFTVHFALYETLTGMLNLGIASGYMFYFLAGYYFTAYPVQGKREIVVYLAGIAGLLVTIFGGAFVRFHNEGQFAMWMDPIRAHSGLYAVALFVLFGRIAPRLPRFICQITQEVSKCSFGVYMLHLSLMTYPIQWLNYQPSGSSSVWNIPLIALITFVLSVGVSAILRRIPFLKRILF